MVLLYLGVIISQCSNKLANFIYLNESMLFFKGSSLESKTRYMYTIENDQLRVTIDPKGAELQSIYDKKGATEYLWNADPAFWGKHSPVLFPIIGTLKNDTYKLDDKEYKLSRHGFAREQMFAVTDQTPAAITFTLVPNEALLKVYPFHFNFSLFYTIENRKLSVTYLVKNEGEEVMYFSVGGHPAFKVPLAEGLSYEDYYLLFNKSEDAGRWPISGEGLITLEPTPLLENTNKLPLDKKLFYTDAIVFKNLNSDEVSLKSDKDAKGFSFEFKGFPYLGIWAAKEADFVCIEPWCGIADSVDTNQDFTKKEGVVKLDAKGTFDRTWSVDIF